jgi:hypothetical protein
MAARSDRSTPTGGSQSLDERLFLATAGYGKVSETVRAAVGAVV